MAVLRWRYGEQLDWRLVTIGLAEDPAALRGRRLHADAHDRRQHCASAATACRSLAEPRARIAATSRACRAIVATRLLDPAREEEVLRALQFGWFTTTLVLDEDADIAAALERVERARRRRRWSRRSTTSARSPPTRPTSARPARAEGGPTDFQGKARQTDGPVRYSAPSLVFESADGRRLEAGGFQPIEAYDVLIANLDPTLERRAPRRGAARGAARVSRPAWSPRRSPRSWRRTTWRPTAPPPSAR